jgi:hypothetical protein
LSKDLVEDEKFKVLFGDFSNNIPNMNSLSCSAYNKNPDPLAASVPALERV